MGREVRRVPPDWVHPQRADGRNGYQPMHDEDYETAAKEWKDGFLAWESGEDPDHAKHPDMEFWEWHGDPPDRKYYKPAFPDGTATHWMMYESVSEGTPISPAFATPEELARWLADTGANACAGMTATYEQWLATIRAGSAPSMVFDGRLRSGVEAMGDRD